MSVSIKTSYREIDDCVCSDISNKILIINEIVRYMTVFKTNGNILLQKLNAIIQEIHQIDPQSLSLSALSILKWIIRYVGLVENISNFYNNSIDELIQLFTKYSSDINARFQEMKTELAKEDKKYKDAVDKFANTGKIHSTILKKLCDTDNLIEQFKKENKYSKANKKEAELKKNEPKYLSAEKNVFEERIATFNSKLQFAAEEERFIIKWEQMGREIYQTIDNILKDYSIKVKQMSKELIDLAQESYKNTLKAIQDECIKIPENENINNFNYEDTFKKLNKKYGYDETLPKLDFNVFKFFQPQEIFKDDLTGTYFIVKQNYKIKNLDEIEAKKGTILKLISTNEDGKLIVRNEENGEIGVISDNNIQPIGEDIKIIRQIRKINNSNNDDPRYVLAMSEPNPETHLVRCMDADGAISMLNDQMLDPPIE